MRRFLLVVALLLAACQQEPPLVWDGEKAVARGWKGAEPAAGWESVLALHASDAPGAPPIAGRYTRRGGTITFTPAFPPSPQVTLRLVYKSPGETLSQIIPGKVPEAGAPTTVQAIYPTIDYWPANQLKFYIQFSSAMSKGQAWDHIQLLDEAGRRIEEPFVEIDQELWDPAVTRLTVLFDPGRIKRGLGDTDPPLVPGNRYTLRIDPAWKDAKGRPLAAAHERRITVLPDLRTPVDPKSWRITAPKTRDDPLIIDFPRPLDHALARRTITIPGVEGEVDLMNAETRWVFRPKARWKRGEHQIRIDGIIEDVAGNRLHRLFDVDTTDPAQTKPPPKFELLRFRVE